MKCSLLAGPFKPKDRRCDLCGRNLPARRKRWCSDKCSKFYYNNHHYTRARRLVRRRDKYRCVRCGSKDSIEVNHIIPCLGRHSKIGCWHHVSNLEVLCHVCHKQETDRQRLAGEFDKKKRKAKRKRRR